MDGEPYWSDGGRADLQRTGGGLLFSLPGENERDREKMGGKVCTGENGSGRLRGSGARREAGEPVCQLLPGSARQPRHTKTQKNHTKACALLPSASVRSHRHYRAARADRRRDVLHAVRQRDGGPGSSAPRLAVLLQHSFYHTNALIICTHGQVFSHCYINL